MRDDIGIIKVGKIKQLGDKMIYTGLTYEDGKYWIMKDKKGFVICRYNGVCGDVVGYASTFEQAKESIDLQRRLRDE